MDAVGRKWGLALLWCRELMVDVINYSQFHINAKVEWKEQNVPWKFTGFYGQAEVCKRKYTWNLLSLLNQSHEISWCIVEDFNEILY